VVDKELCSCAKCNCVTVEECLDPRTQCEHHGECCRDDLVRTADHYIALETVDPFTLQPVRG
jgi:hypothetical protein